MNERWNLDPIYAGFDAPTFEADMQELKSLVEKIAAFAESLPNAEPLKGLTEGVALQERFTVLVSKLAGFASLRQSADTRDSEAGSRMGQVMQLYSGVAAPFAAFQDWATKIPGLMELVKADENLRDYTFMFENMADSARFLLPGVGEAVMAKMSLSGGDAWSEMQQYLTSTVPVTYRGETTNLSAIRNLASDPDPVVRKEAYEAELACYKKIRDPIAFALNSIKSQVNTEAELRGYADPLAMTLEDSRMEKATLDAMLEAMREYMPKFREYLRHKAKLLGYENGLPWYELYAQMGDASAQTFTVEEAHKYLVEHFESFAPDLAEMVDRAFKEDWIDFYPRAGKVGGAFCSNLPFFGQSRILTNFSGSFGSVVTLAHELGHAYHGQQIESHRPLNTGYTMPVAETASNFNELIIVNDAISKAKGGEKIALIESQIQDCAQIIVDIYSRFLFEDEVIRRRKNKFMFADELEAIMLDAQKQAYGDGLDPDYLHPYMWCCKSHYYSAGLSYYNFPYAFGGLFSRGLYAKYLEEGEAFLPKYRALLKATTVESVENVAKIAGIDLTKPEFWRTSLQVIADRIDEFIAETSK